jgi:5-carboxyvanillate decarboxylase
VRTIAVEEHFWTEEWVDYLRARKDFPKIVSVRDGQGRSVESFAYSPSQSSAVDGGMVGKLMEVGEARLADMDRAGIDMQVLCIGSGLEPFEAAEATSLSRIINDGLARIIARNPSRFAGFATLAPQDPEGAAAELERSVRSLGLKGAKLNSHVRGETFDQERFWPIFEAAERLDVPIYLHPRTPPADQLKVYADYPLLSASIWGFGADMGLNAMKLVCSGVFDRYPKLKIILGHLGEALPFWLWRIDNRWFREGADKHPRMKRLKKKPGDYIRENFWFSTSGVFSEAPLRCAITAMGAERILFAVDYPYESNSEGGRFIREVPISEEQRASIAHRNAERLLKLA